MNPWEQLRYKQDTYVAPRTLEEAFGKGAKLDTEKASDKVSQRGEAALMLFSLFGICCLLAAFCVW